MKYLAAYALVALSGKTPAKADVEAVLKAAGVSVDSARMQSLFAELDGKNFDDVCKEGKAKLVGSGPAAGAGAGAGAKAAPAAEAKKAEPEEEEDDEMGFGLFD